MKKVVMYITVLALWACEKKELPVKKYNRGDLVLGTAEMAPDYRNQVWYSLASGKVVSSNLKTAWDIAFESTDNGYHVYLNTSKAMRAYKTNYTQLADVNDTTGLGLGGKADNPGGSPDSTAIGNLKDNNTIYIINRGYNEKGEQLGYYKFKITEVTSNSYRIEFGDVYTKTTYTAHVVKNTQHNYIAFSFDSKMQVNIEPEKTTYDLCFTQYTHLFYNPTNYYQVTGVLLNPSCTRIMQIQDKKFSDIGLNDTLGTTFSRRRDAIGYTWKTFVFSTNLYTVNPQMCFIINDCMGFYYKLHFIDFYDSQGNKGFPKFEYIKL